MVCVLANFWIPLGSELLGVCFWPLFGMCSGKRQGLLPLCSSLAMRDGNLKFIHWARARAFECAVVSWRASAAI
jgi:hypothetical protein